MKLGLAEKIVLALLILIVGYYILGKLLFAMFSGSVECHDKSNGWYCDGNMPMPIFMFFIQGEYEKKCVADGGITNWGHPLLSVVCELPLDDTGKTCTSASQCKGSCYVEEEDLKSKFPEIKPHEYFGLDCSGCKAQCYKYNVTCNGFPPYTLDENGKIAGKIIC